MTTVGKIDLTCPCCETGFEGRVIFSTNTFGGKTTDFHGQAMGAEPLHYIISTCPECGFTDYSNKWPEKGSLKAETRARVNSEIKPLAGGDRLAGSLRYRSLALICEWEGRGAVAVADSYLKAAWLAAGEEGNTEIGISCRRLAIENFEKGLAEMERSDERYLTLSYLVGELYRRVGERDRANEWFDKVIRIAQPSDPEWVVEIARQQRTDPKEFFSK